MPAPRSTPLLISGDPDLVDTVLRLAAAAGVPLDVAGDIATALRCWSAAPLVLVGADLAGELAAASPPRRVEVHLLAQEVEDSHYRAAVAIGAGQVCAVRLAEDRVVEILADVADGGPSSAVTLGFLGGAGGVGATTLACAVAVRAAAGSRAALVDLDPLGPGVERVVGLEGADGVRWADLSGSRGRLGSRAVRDSLPRQGDLVVLGWGSSPGDPLDEVAAREVLTALERGHDLVVVDLPRNLDDLAAAVAARCDHLVLVGGCSVPGAAAAARARERLRRWTTPVHLVARTHGGAVEPEQLARALGLPLVAVLPDQRRLPEQLDLGLGPLHASRGAVAKAARRVLASVAGPAREAAA